MTSHSLQSTAEHEKYEPQPVMRPRRNNIFYGRPCQQKPCKQTVCTVFFCCEKEACENFWHFFWQEQINLRWQRTLLKRGAAHNAGGFFFAATNQMCIVLFMCALIWKAAAQRNTRTAAPRGRGRNDRGVAGTAETAPQSQR